MRSFEYKFFNIALRIHWVTCPLEGRDMAELLIITLGFALRCLVFAKCFGKGQSCTAKKRPMKKPCANMATAHLTIGSSATSIHDLLGKVWG